jgi:hypothetical protein
LAFFEESLMKKIYLLLALIAFIIPFTYCQNTPIDSIAYEYDTIVIEKDPLIINKQIVIETTLQKEKPRVSVDLFYSPLLLNQYDDTFNEGPELSLTIGTSLHYRSRHKTISLGISLTELSGTEAYIETFSYFKTDTLDVYYVVKGKDTTWVYETGDVKVTDSLKITHQNKYTYIDIPILVGMSKDIGKTTFAFSVGGVVGIPVKVNGVRNRGAGKTGKDKLSTASLNKVNISVFIGGSVSYKVLQNVGVFIYPYIRYGLTEIYASKEGKNGKIFGAGLRVGLNYFF